MADDHATDTRRKPARLVESTMRRRKRGTLRSSSGDKVTSRKQAIAIALSEARDKGARVPPNAGDAEEIRAYGFWATTMNRRPFSASPDTTVNPASVSSRETVWRPTP